MKKLTAVLLMVLICFSLSSCQKQELETPPVNSPENNATLYIGTEDTDFKEYGVYIEGEISPEKLIKEIETLTDWNLELYDEVTSGKGGMTVCFSRNCSIFTGPPMPQKDEFHVYDRNQLVRTILDSIKKTLQMNYVISPGNPDNLDIWYCAEDTEPLEIPEIDKYWTLEEPYKW